VKRWFLWTLILCAGFLGGCCFPGIAGGEASLVDAQGASAPPEPLVAVFCWVHPSVNNEGGRLEIVDVRRITEYGENVKFPARLYWMFWSPPLGTQHIAPEMCALLFQADTPPKIIRRHTFLCCQKPPSKVQLVVSRPAKVQPVASRPATDSLPGRSLEQESPAMAAEIDLDSLSDEDRAVVVSSLNTTK
jgi:hypothetical protein